MNKEEYRARLQTDWWKILAKELKDLVLNTCQICGDSNKDTKLHIHHLSYNNLGNDKEWDDVVVVCECCHVTYHSVHPQPPQGRFSREEKLRHFAETVANKGVDIYRFLKNVEIDLRHWRFFCDLAVADANKAYRLSAPKKVKYHIPPPKPKKTTQPPKKNSGLPQIYDFSAIKRNKDLEYRFLYSPEEPETQEVIRGFGLERRHMPKKWKRALRFYLLQNPL